MAKFLFLLVFGFILFFFLGEIKQSVNPIIDRILDVAMIGYAALSITFIATTNS
jgi:hypothetical protein